METYLPGIGDLVDERFRIVRKLGAGGFAIVYEAKDIGLDREIALKYLDPAIAADREASARFEREGKTLSKLSNSGIAQVYYCGRDSNGLVFMAMELIPGRTLASEINAHGPFPWQIAVPTFIKVCRALQCAHEASIFHRDISPHNIMTVGDYPNLTTKMIDFGLAKNEGAEDANAQKLTAEGTTLGNPNYMSPEQTTGKDSDARSDIYSLAVVLFETLTGHQPFVADNLVGIMYKHLYEPAPSLLDHLPATAEYNEGLDRIIQRCLHKDPNERFASAEDLASELELLIDEQKKDSFSSKHGAAKVSAGRKSNNLKFLGGALLVSISIFLVSSAIWFNHPSKKIDPTDTAQAQLNQALQNALQLDSSNQHREADVIFRRLFSDRDFTQLSAKDKIRLVENLIRRQSWQPQQRKAMIDKAVGAITDLIVLKQIPSAELKQVTHAFVQEIKPSEDADLKIASKLNNLGTRLREAGYNYLALKVFDHAEKCWVCTPSDDNNYVVLAQILANEAVQCAQFGQRKEVVAIAKRYQTLPTESVRPLDTVRMADAASFANIAPQLSRDFILQSCRALQGAKPDGEVHTALVALACTINNLGDYKSETFTAPLWKTFDAVMTSIDCTACPSMPGEVLYHRSLAEQRLGRLSSAIQICKRAIRYSQIAHNVPQEYLLMRLLSNYQLADHNMADSELTRTTMRAKLSSKAVAGLEEIQRADAIALTLEADATAMQAYLNLEKFEKAEQLIPIMESYASETKRARSILPFRLARWEASISEARYDFSDAFNKMTALAKAAKMSDEPSVRLSAISYSGTAAAEARLLGLLSERDRHCHLVSEAIVAMNTKANQDGNVDSDWNFRISSARALMVAGKPQQALDIFADETTPRYRVFAGISPHLDEPSIQMWANVLLGNRDEALRHCRNLEKILLSEKLVNTGISSYIRDCHHVLNMLGQKQEANAVLQSAKLYLAANALGLELNLLHENASGEKNSKPLTKRDLELFREMNKKIYNDYLCERANASLLRGDLKLARAISAKQLNYWLSSANGPPLFTDDSVRVARETLSPSHPRDLLLIDSVYDVSKKNLEKLSALKGTKSP